MSQVLFEGNSGRAVGKSRERRELLRNTEVNEVCSPYLHCQVASGVVGVSCIYEVLSMEILYAD